MQANFSEIACGRLYRFGARTCDEDALSFKRVPNDLRIDCIWHMSEEACPFDSFILHKGCGPFLRATLVYAISGFAYSRWGLLGGFLYRVFGALFLWVHRKN